MTHIALGIDLGVKQACVFLADGTNEVKVVPGQNSESKTWSCFLSYSYQDKGSYKTIRNLVGAEAVQAMKNGQPCLYDTKRLIGRSIRDPDVQKLKPSLKFEIKNEENCLKMGLKYTHWEQEERYFTPEEVTAKLLKYLKESAERFSKTPAITKVVLTVPSRFNWFQRLAMKNSALIAGFEDIEIINEATAAAIAYFRDFRVHENVLVFDFGRSKFEVTLLRIEGKDVYISGTGGDCFLGGDDLTENLVNHVKKVFRTERNAEYDPNCVELLREECEKKKIELFTTNSPFVKFGYMGYVRGTTPVTRELFWKLNQELLGKTIQTSEDVLERAGLEKTKLDRIVLIGGSALILKLQEKLKEAFPKATITSNLDPQTVVAQGAALQVQAGFVEHTGFISESQIESRVKALRVPGIFTTSTIGVKFDYDYQVKHNLDSNYGILVPKGTKIPFTTSYKFWFPVDGKGETTFAIYDGDHNIADENTLIHSEILSNLPPKYVQLKIKLYLNSHGKLLVDPKHSGWIKNESKKKIIIDVFERQGAQFVHQLQNDLDPTLMRSNEWPKSIEPQLSVPDATESLSIAQRKVAINTYQRSMETVVSSFDKVPSEEFRSAHEKAVHTALIEMSKVHPLTEDIINATKEPLEEIYTKYKKLNDRKSKGKYTLGIDLGTCYCSVAVIRENEDLEVIQNKVGRVSTPSYVAFHEDHITVGDVSKETAYLDPENTIFDMKRMIGRHFNNPEVNLFKKYWPFQIQDDGGNILILARGRPYRPEEIITILLTHLKEMTEEFLNEDIVNVVVAVPAYFNELQKQLTKEACHNAGLSVLKLVSEPTAAALAYHHVMSIKDKPNRCLIFDLGGGTFDVAILETSQDRVKIKAIDGDPNLGGEDFDNAMMDYCIAEFEKEHNLQLTLDAQYSRKLRRLKSTCEAEKCKLSFRIKKVVVTVDAFHGHLDLVVHITQEQFRSLIQHHVDRCMIVLEEFLAKENIEHLDEIVLVGGSSRIDFIRETLNKKFPNSVLVKKLDPEVAVAKGAAILAGMIQKRSSSGVYIEEMEKIILM